MTNLRYSKNKMQTSDDFFPKQPMIYFQVYGYCCHEEHFVKFVYFKTVPVVVGKYGNNGRKLNRTNR